MKIHLGIVKLMATSMKEVIHQEFELRYQDGEIIRGDLRYVPSNDPKPLLIFCHGFKGFKNWGFYPYLTTSFAKLGYHTLVFNFSLNGIGDDLLNFTRLEKFKENTFTREVEELEFVINSVLANEIQNFQADLISNIALVGHSRGGSAVIANASKFNEVKAVVTLASICRMRFPDAERETEWRRTGVTHILNLRTGQKMPLGVPLLDDMYQHEHRIKQSAKALNKPLLIIHGDNDPTVDLAEAKELQAWAVSSKLEVIENGDHVFNIKHPWDGTSENLERVITLVDDFFIDKSFTK